MDKEEKKKLRKRLMFLLNDPNADQTEILRIGKLLGGNGKKVVKAEGKKERTKYIDPKQYIEWRSEGITRTEICERLGIGIKRLKSEITMLKQNGLLPTDVLKKGPIPKFTMTKEEYLSCGLTRKEICEMYGINNSSLSNRLKKWGLSKTRKRDILSYETYCELKRTLMQDREIEIMYGFGKGTIYRLKREWAKSPIKNNVQM